MNKLIANSLAIGVLTLAQVAWADDLDKSKSLFGNRCAACHGAAGVGVEGLAPPLQNPELWKSLGGNGAKYMAGVMTGGMTGTITVADVDYSGLVMPAQSFIEMRPPVATVKPVTSAGSKSAGREAAKVSLAANQSPSRRASRRKTELFSSRRAQSIVG